MIRPPADGTPQRELKLTHQSAGPGRERLNPAQVRVVRLTDDGVIPNNPELPLILYQNALQLPERDPAAWVEELLAGNGWEGSWRNGIYPYHHYHSTAHEVLMVFRGRATVQLGGEHGIITKIQRGDGMVLPAGVGHKNMEHSDDFAVVGAYPHGQHWDLCYGRPGERPKTDKNIARVGRPTSDPLYGPEGPLMDHWK